MRGMNMKVFKALGNESYSDVRFYNYRIDQRYFDLRAGLATALERRLGIRGRFPGHAASHWLQHRGLIARGV